MYYDSVKRTWIIDLIDLALISFMIGSILGSSVKYYLSKKKSTRVNPLKESDTKELILDSRINKVYKVALQNRGGQLENFQLDFEISDDILKSKEQPKLAPDLNPDLNPELNPELNPKLNPELNDLILFHLAQLVRKLVESSYNFLKRQESKGRIAQYISRNLTSIIRIGLQICQITMTHHALLLSETTTQIIIVTATSTGIIGFISAWLKMGSLIITITSVMSAFFLRGFAQRLVSLRLRKVNHQNVQQPITKVSFVDAEITKVTRVEMKSPDVNKDYLPKFDSNLKETSEIVKPKKLKRFAKLIDSRDFKYKAKKAKVKYYRDLAADYIDDLVEEFDDLMDSETVQDFKNTVDKIRND
jgi:hypothetical protein